MEKGNSRLTCKDIRGIDVVDFLAGIGHQPVKVRNHDYWYLSPLRVEKTASFKVNRKINCWFDFQLWQGGDIIDFATRYHNCTIGDLLKSMSPYGRRNLSDPPSSRPEENTLVLPTIQIVHTGIITDPQLLNYLIQRRIPAPIADTHCQQASFELKEKTYSAIAFKNDLGGYELRNSWFKGSTRPKAITTKPAGTGKSAAVFEGFFDFLSYLAVIPDPDPDQDIIILNGLGMIPMIRHKVLDLFLDRDTAGREATLLLCNSSPSVHDRSELYCKHKDLNEFLCHWGSGRTDTVPGLGND